MKRHSLKKRTVAIVMTILMIATSFTIAEWNDISRVFAAETDVTFEISEPQPADAGGPSSVHTVSGATAFTLSFDDKGTMTLPTMADLKARGWNVSDDYNNVFVGWYTLDHYGPGYWLAPGDTITINTKSSSQVQADVYPTISGESLYPVFVDLANPQNVDVRTHIVSLQILGPDSISAAGGSYDGVELTLKDVNITTNFDNLNEQNGYIIDDVNGIRGSEFIGRADIYNYGDMLNVSLKYAINSGEDYPLPYYDVVEVDGENKYLAIDAWAPNDMSNSSCTYTTSIPVSSEKGQTCEWSITGPANNVCSADWPAIQGFEYLQAANSSHDYENFAQIQLPGDYVDGYDVLTYEGDGGAFYYIPAGNSNSVLTKLPESSSYDENVTAVRIEEYPDIMLLGDGAYETAKVYHTNSNVTLKTTGQQAYYRLSPLFTPESAYAKYEIVNGEEVIDDGLLAVVAASFEDGAVTSSESDNDWDYCDFQLAELSLPEEGPESADPSKEFAGWTDGNNNYEPGAIISGLVVSSDKLMDEEGRFTAEAPAFTFRPVYNTREFTVEFVDYDGSLIKSETVLYGGDATPPTNPSRDGYTFTGWQGSYTSVIENQTVTATYEAVPTTEDETVPTTEDETVPATEDETVLATEDDTVPAAEDETVTSDADTPPVTDDSTSSLLTSLVRVISNGSMGTLTYNFTQESINDETFSFIIPANSPTREGYYFNGWRNSRDNMKYMPGENLVLRYDWRDIDFTAIWVAILGRGRSRLETGTEYRFGDGSWSVNGDTTVYNGNQSFYVSEAGDYTIE